MYDEGPACRARVDNSWDICPVQDSAISLGSKSWIGCPRHYCRNCVLVHQLRMRIPAQQDTEIVKPSNNPLKLDPIDEKNGYRCFVFPDVVQENVLNVL